jgi:hypothetical protein
MILRAVQVFLPWHMMKVPDPHNWGRLELLLSPTSQHVPLRDFRGRRRAVGRTGEPPPGVVSVRMLPAGMEDVTV